MWHLNRQRPKNTRIYLPWPPDFLHPFAGALVLQNWPDFRARDVLSLRWPNQTGAANSFPRLASWKTGHWKPISRRSPTQGTLWYPLCQCLNACRNVQMRSVKGSHIIQAQDWVDARLGMHAFRELTRSGGASWAAILPMGWYDVDVLNPALRAASRRLGMSLEDVVTEIASKNAEHDLTSIYRVFLRVAQPQRVLAQTARLWRTYVSFGEASALRNEKGHYLGLGSGFDAELLDWACGCWRGFIPTTIAVAGGRNARARIIERKRETNGLYSVQLEVTYSL